MGDAVWTAMVDDPLNVWVLEHEDARATERGLEFRFPFLSWDLLALVMSVPGNVAPFLMPPNVAARKAAAANEPTA